MDGGERLTLQLMDGGLDKADLPQGIMEAQFHDYLEGFLQSSVEEDGEDGDAAANAPWLDRADRPDVYLRRSKLVAVGLCELNPVVTHHSLKAPGFNPRN
jgi:hypothetical protein